MRSQEDGDKGFMTYKGLIGGGKGDNIAIPTICGLQGAAHRGPEIVAARSLPAPYLPKVDTQRTNGFFPCQRNCGKIEETVRSIRSCMFCGHHHFHLEDQKM